MRMVRTLPPLLLLLGVAAASYSCDAEYGAHCPEESPGSGLLECLTKARDDGKDVSDNCKGWLGMMDACEDDLEKFCAGQEADAFLCLTQWTKRHDLSDGCAKALPEEKKEEEKPRKKKKSRAKAKRRAHEKAMKLAAEQEERKKRDDEAKRRPKKSKKGKKKKGKKSKKGKKKKKTKSSRQRGGDVDDDETSYDEL
eukprot:g6724.t1